MSKNPTDGIFFKWQYKPNRNETLPAWDMESSFSLYVLHCFTRKLCMLATLQYLCERPEEARFQFPCEDRNIEIHCHHCLSTWAERRGAASLPGEKQWCVYTHWVSCSLTSFCLPLLSGESGDRRGPGCCAERPLPQRGWMPLRVGSNYYSMCALLENKGIWLRKSILTIVSLRKWNLLWFYKQNPSWA